MFMGQFMEAHLGRDEPVTLDRVSPDIFEIVIRFG
jgi:hypothetical protein